MILKEIPPKETVFIDANIFLYHFTGVSLDCKEFLKRCENQDLQGVTATTVLAEVCHHLMLAESITSGFITAQKPTSQLQKKPEIIKKLSQYYIQLTSIFTWNIKVLTPPIDLITKSQIYRSQFGLLTNDSFIPVFMSMANTDKIATSDKIFSNIPSFKAYFPSDIVC